MSLLLLGTSAKRIWIHTGKQMRKQMEEWKRELADFEATEQEATEQAQAATKMQVWIAPSCSFCFLILSSYYRPIVVLHSEHSLCIHSSPFCPAFSRRILSLHSRHG